MFVDTNVFLRFLLADVPAQSAAARVLMSQVAAGERRAWTTPIVFFELTYVLSGSSAGQLDRQTIVDRLNSLLEFEELVVEQREVLREGLRIYGAHNVDFADAYHAALVRSRGESRVWSFDHDFDALEGIERQEPGSSDDA